MFIFALEAWAKMQAYRAYAAGKLKTEISGVGRVSLVEGVPCVQEVRILKQSVATGETELDPEAWENFILAGNNTKDWCFHWHSHPGRSVTPSTIDHKMYAGMRNTYRQFISVILSNDGQLMHSEIHHGGLIHTVAPTPCGGMVWNNQPYPMDAAKAVDQMNWAVELLDIRFSVKEEVDTLLELPKPPAPPANVKVYPPGQLLLPQKTPLVRNAHVNKPSESAVQPVYWNGIPYYKTAYGEWVEYDESLNLVTLDAADVLTDEDKELLDHCAKVQSLNEEDWIYYNDTGLLPGETDEDLEKRYARKEMI